MIRMIRRLVDSARTLLGRRTFERDLDEELRFHLEQQTADLIGQGIPEAEARRRARAMFGAVEGFKDDARDARGIGWIDQLRGDFRFALRTIQRAPGFAAVAILTLGLGIGANTTIFSVIDGVLLKPLPFPESDRLVRVTPSYPNGALPIYRAETRSYQEVGSYTFDSELNLLVDGIPERVSGRNVSAEFFDVLRVRAALGRTFHSGEDALDAPLVAAISDNLWRRRFGADPAVIGRTIVVDGTPRELVGVLPRGFAFPTAGTEVWIPNRIDTRNAGHLWGAGGTTFIARLKSGVTVEQADAEHRGMITRVRDAYPWRMPDSYGQGPDNRVRALTEVIGEGVEDRLILLLGAVGLVLLVACVNVANLNLTRVAARERELAVRQAIGGTRARIGRQLMVEQLVLAAAGGLLGIAAALVGTPVLVSWLPSDTPRLESVVVDGRVLLFTAATVLLAATLSALGPAFKAARSRGAAAFGSAGRAAGLSPWGRRLSGGLVVAEIALAVVLLVGAGVLLRSLAALLRENPGVRVDGIVTARITQDLARCGASMGACSMMFDRIEQSLAAIPGVSGVALASMIPLDGQVAWFAMDIEDNPTEPGAPAHQLNAYQVTPDYFRIAGIRLEEGRLLDRNDTCADQKSWGPCLRDRGVVVVSRALAETYWPGRSALGRKVKPVWLSDWATIVGVVSDVRQGGLNQKPNPDFYWAIAQWGAERMTAIVETALPPTAVEPALRRAVASVDPTTPVSRVQSMASIVSQSVATSRTSAILLTLFAAVALVLGAIGVYGVLSYGVSQRRQEIGIRMAIGAEPGRVRRMIVGEAMGLITGGLLVGSGLAVTGGRLLERFVYGVGVLDPVTFGAVPAVFLAVGMLAAYLPARRATRVSPTVALRAE